MNPLTLRVGSSNAFQPLQTHSSGQPSATAASRRDFWTNTANHTLYSRPDDGLQTRPLTHHDDKHGQCRAPSNPGIFCKRGQHRPVNITGDGRDGNGRRLQRHVQYLISRVSPHCHSGWQPPKTEWVDTGLAINTQYCYWRAIPGTACQQHWQRIRANWCASSPCSCGPPRCAHRCARSHSTSSPQAPAST